MSEQTTLQQAVVDGADVVIDPTKMDSGLAVKEHTKDQGADISLECSGSYAALNDALRATGYRGTIVSLAYYTGEAKAQR